jgi:hypothetical protein
MLRRRPDRRWTASYVWENYPLPVTINTLASPLRSTVENHLLNYVGSDLLDVLAGKKSFQEALNSPMK